MAAAGTAEDDDDAPGGPASLRLDAGPASLRLDKWLWHARFARTRSLAAKLVAETGVRVNGAPTRKPAQAVRPGDVLTFALGRGVRVVAIRALGLRRGPAPEARTLYDDLSDPGPRPGDAAASASDGTPAEAPPAPRDPGAGRPSKAERRALDRLRPEPGD